LLSFSVVSLTFPFNIYINPQEINNSQFFQFFNTYIQNNPIPYMQTLQQKDSTISALNRTISSQTTTINSLNSEITKLSTNISALQTQIRDLNNKLSLATVQVSGSASTTGGTITYGIIFQSGTSESTASVTNHKYTTFLANNKVYIVTVQYFTPTPSFPVFGTCTPSNNVFTLNSTATNYAMPAFSC